MASNKSIYSLISSNIEGDKLKEGFSIRKDNFADGAYDGILSYHSEITEPDEKTKSAILAVLKKASTGNYDKANEMYLAIGKPTLTLIDGIQDIIYDNQQSLNENKIYGYALSLILESSEIELVKLGLSILEIFDIDDDEDVKALVSIIGMSDEFSLFSVFNMRKWSDADESIFDLITSVTGWGRIHGIHFLSDNPSDEIKRWLLTDGWKNSVMTEYSSLDIFTKSGAIDLLQNEDKLEPEILRGIAETVKATQNAKSMPIVGLEHLGNFMEIKKLFLANCEGTEDEEVKKIAEFIQGTI
ncbi:MAG: hypothetical protein K5745_02425 [Saccharofermentans sp.]|nr:hypothetical protein [Saccharofermentans sp.]